MNKLGRKLMLAGICVCLASGTLSGCAPKADTTIATLDGTSVDFGVASFMLRYNQAQMQSMYGSYLGDSYWSSYGTSTRDSVMESLQEMLILEQHMDEYDVTITEDEHTAITEAAKAFMEDNEESVIKALAVTEETVARTLTLYTVSTKMKAAIIADVDTEVSDEEAAQKTINYALFSTAATTDDDGNSVELTDDEKSELKDQAQQVLDLVKGGQDLETALTSVDEEGTVQEASYGEDNGDIADEVKAAADELTDGQYADEVIETDSGYYVVVMQSTFDEEATESQKSTIVSQRQSDKYDEVYEAWKEEASFETKDKVVEKLTFNDIYDIKTTETETDTEVGTDTGTDTEADTETEAGTDTGTETDMETDLETQSDTGAETETEA